MNEYNPKEIEKKWQDIWEEKGVFHAQDDFDKPGYYVLIEFPYPSGSGLHVGHPRSYTALDIVARKRRMQGYNVLYPIGWDAFGLPTENFAIKNKIHPRKVTEQNVARFKSQLMSLGLSFDWSREINTTDPSYYKWTQWIFLKLFEKGLAYKKEVAINWCTDCKVGLANEEVVNGVCERCGSEVVKKVKNQWMLKITEYAERLINDLDIVDYVERVKVQQKNWIGRSEGMEVDFQVVVEDGKDVDDGGNCCGLCEGGKNQGYIKHGEFQSNRGLEECREQAECREQGECREQAECREQGQDQKQCNDKRAAATKLENTLNIKSDLKPVIEKNSVLRVYTTRPDTLYGATYMVISPEHPLVEEFCQNIKNLAEIEAYREQASKKSDFERTEIAKDKTGVRISGICAINPVNGKQIPVFVSDYVLMSYGTGAIMAVPAHDTRDYEFAVKFSLPIIEVVAGGNVEKEAYTDIENGILINSGLINGLSVPAAKEKISNYLEEKGLGKRKTNYKLRDWVFSRQRYWGEPIPLVWCDTCGWVALPYSELPLTLPEVDNYEPTDTGESPLAKMNDWVNTTCPQCKGPAKRETDTMPQWAGSSWYFLRYIDPYNDQALASKEKLDYWTPVNWYNGGMEHTTLHLLYSRFWHKFLYDIGVVPTSEPYMKRTSHGMILGENNEKMSKSRGNVVNPDDIIDEFGADTLRLYEMFIGDFEKSIPWSQNGVKGCRRFIERVWRLVELIDMQNGTSGIALKTGDSGEYSKELEISIHRTIKKAGEDFENLKFNTAVAAMMSLVNEYYSKGSINKAEFKVLLLLLNPVAPHFTEELWQMIGFEGLASIQGWPSYDEAKTVEDMTEIVIQINGKIKERLLVPTGLDKAGTEEKALSEEKVKALLEGVTVNKIITVPGKLVNIVVR